MLNAPWYGSARSREAGSEPEAGCHGVCVSEIPRFRTIVRPKRHAGVGRRQRRARRLESTQVRRKSMNPSSQIPRKTPSERPGANELPLPSTKGDGAGPEAAGNVDKIRDILFGSQMRDYDKKFGRFEERLAGETAELREEMKRRFASLEAYVKNEVTALADQLKVEKGERGEADKDLGRELKESVKAWEKKASQIEEQTTKALRDLRQHVLEEAKRLGEDMEQKHKALSAALEKESQELRASLTDRLALADLFSEVSLRLKNEFKVPAKK